ncbi:MAG: AI-2E family transporter [Candidatus Cloacimonetes bacterium]|nr:AI-2E family transporter [Candidatus Cloacimonadota bacterium]
MNWTRLIFTLIILLACVLALVFYSPLLIYLLLALVLAYFLDPAITWMEYKKIPRWLGVLILYFIIAGVLTWLIATYVPELIRQGNQFLALLSRTDQSPLQLIVDLPVIRSLHELVENLDHSVPQMHLLARFDSFLETAVNKIGEFPQLLISNYQPILGTLAMVLMVPIFSFFLLSDKKRIRRALMSLVPNKYFEITLILLKKVDENVGNYIRAILLEMLAVGIMSTFVLSIVGVPYAIVIGAIAGLTNIIPYIGPWLGGLIAVLVILISGMAPVNIIWAGLAMFLVQQVDNYMVYPAIIGKTMKMHPLLVILTVLAGSYFGGVIWMLISVPLVYMIFSLLSALQKNLKEFRII